MVDMAPKMGALPRKSSSPSMTTAMAFHPATKLSNGNDSMWSRLLRPFTAPNTLVNRFLPKLKSGALLLEVGDKAEWVQFEVVLAGASINDLGLYYYAHKTAHTPVGCIPLHSAHIDVLEEVVMVLTQDKTWFLCAEHGRDAGDWAEAVCESIDKVSQGILLQGKALPAVAPGPSPAPAPVLGSTAGGSKRRRRRLSSHVSAVTLREIQSREPRARVDEFLEIFVRSNDDETRLQAMEGALSWSCMRNIAWKLWLNVVPLDTPFRQWLPVLQAKRVNYETLRADHAIFHPFCQARGGGDLQDDDDAFINACETSQDILLYAIYKDVRRTRGAMEFFRSSSLQCLLIRILYTYSHAHPEISYNQGMGELLATIVYLLHIEQWPRTSSASSSGDMGMSKSFSHVSLTASSSTGSFVSITPSSSTGRLSESDSDDASYVYVESFIDIQEDAAYLDRDKFLQATPFTGGGGATAGKYSDCCKEAAEEIVREMTSACYIEHDAYLLLEEMMERMAGAYCPEITFPSSSPSCPTRPPPPPPSTEGESTSPMYDQMNNIHHLLLRRCDPPTARHLSQLGVEPQMFVLRWVRVLMSREFEMAQVWQIWDAIFSLTPRDFSFINLLCVAAVREFRDEILHVEDPTAVLLCLRDLSEKVDADRLVEHAKELYDALMVAAAVEASNGE